MNEVTGNVGKFAEASESAEPRRRGRPRKIPVLRSDQISENREIAGGRATAIGRDGRVLSRRRSGEADKFAIPPHIIPDGWTYEWKSKTILGQEQTDHITGLMENGWTPVPAERHAGQFMVRSGTGEIVRDGLVLMERPVELTEEARQEDKALARLQVRQQIEQYRAKMPSGMDASHPDARERVRTSYEAGPDSDGYRPAHN